MQDILNAARKNINKFYEQKGILTTLKQERGGCINKLKAYEDRYSAIGEASVLIQEVAKDSQKKIKVQLSSLVTKALHTIYPEEDYIFTLNFDSKKGQTSVYPMLLLDKHELDPLDNSGGMAEVISFALRIALIALGKKDRLLVLDEPFTGVSKTRLPLVQEFIKQMGEEFDMQFIITTHLPGLTANANKSFTVTKEDGFSVIEES